MKRSLDLYQRARTLVDLYFFKLLTLYMKLLQKFMKLLLIIVFSNFAIANEPYDLYKSINENIKINSYHSDELNIESKNILVEDLSKLDEIKIRLEEYELILQKYRHSVPLIWALSAMFVCFILGIFFGFWFFDQRTKRRHGGVRIY